MAKKKPARKPKKRSAQKSRKRRTARKVGVRKSSAHRRALAKEKREVMARVSEVRDILAKAKFSTWGQFRRFLQSELGLVTSKLSFACEL